LFIFSVAPNRLRVFAVATPACACCSGLDARGRREPLFIFSMAALQRYFAFLVSK
jgi:hypothetical protein